MSLLSNWWTFGKLRRIRRKQEREYAKELEKYKADKTKTLEDFAGLNAEGYSDAMEAEEAINRFRSTRLLEEATEYDIEAPQPSAMPDYWTSTEDGQYWHLSAKGRTAIKALVRAEKNQTFEEWAKWAKTFGPLISAIAGLIGVLIGLAAILRNHR
jgi:hypothetical protein